MVQIDINKDIDRAETAARTIRTFDDLERDSETGEEFEGYNDISQGEDSDPDSDGQTNDLKVRYFSQFMSREVLTHRTEDKQSTSEKDQGPPSKS